MLGRATFAPASAGQKGEFPMFSRQKFVAALIGFGVVIAFAALVPSVRQLEVSIHGWGWPVLLMTVIAVYVPVKAACLYAVGFCKGLGVKIPFAFEIKKLAGGIASGLGIAAAFEIAHFLASKSVQISSTDGLVLLWLFISTAWAVADIIEARLETDPERKRKLMS
jgi:hypothetical protein